jgi:mono/diheme cytochrome c family protein
MKRLFTSAVVVLMLSSCTHDPINPDPNPGPDPSHSCHPDTVYFVNEVLPLFTANCASSGCHGDSNPADGLSLTTYDGIMDEVKAGNPNNSEVYEVLFETGNKQMPPPPAAPLDSLSKWKIYTWIAQGAQNNSCSDCDTTSGSFSQTILPIIQSQCQSCHSSGNASGGVVLSDHAHVVAAVNNSGLVAAIHRMNNSPMPPAASLSDCELAQFDKWITDGMPNN